MHKRFSNLLQKYGHWDNQIGTDKQASHSYGPVYEEVFQNFYERKGLEILEIGVYSGASACVWAELFNNCNVDGIDINMKTIRYGKDFPNIHYFLCDGTSERAPKLLNEKVYDIIIEDASHLPEHQVLSFKIFAPYVSKGGIYIIEDINGKFADTVYKQLKEIADTNNFQMDWRDLRSIKGRFDDIIAVFTKY